MKPVIIVIDDFPNGRTVFKCTTCGVVDAISDFDKLHMTDAVLNHVCNAIEEPKKC